MLFNPGEAAALRESAPARARRGSHEERVRRRSDADREQAGVAEMTADVVEDLLLVAHLPVRDEDDLADIRMLRRAVLERQLQSRHHLGAARRLQRAHPTQRLIDYIAIRAPALIEEASRRAVELDHVEAV